MVFGREFYRGYINHPCVPNTALASAGFHTELTTLHKSNCPKYEIEFLLRVIGANRLQLTIHTVCFGTALL